LLADDQGSTTAAAAPEQQGTTTDATDAPDQGSEAAAAAPVPAAERKPQDERYTDRSCAWIMHFINLFRERRPIDGPDEKPTDRTADFTANVKACRARYGMQ
jgi:hypothetical protein